MIKLTKRKAFNFLRSYFDVLNEIPEDKDKLIFLMSIINKQFLDEDPKNLDFIPNLCYESQRHAIEKSVKGWKTANKTNLLGDPIPPPKGDPIPPPKEEEEEEQEKEQGQEEEEVKELDQDCLYNIDTLQEYYLSKNEVVNSIITNSENKIKDKEHLIKRLNEFKTNLTSQGRLSEKFNEYTRYFLAWNRKSKTKINGNPLKPTQNLTF